MYEHRSSVQVSRSRSSRSDQETWRLLYDRQRQSLEGRACGEFIKAVQKIEPLIYNLPSLELLSEALYSHSGWQIYPVDGLVDSDEFFRLLANRYFPAVTSLRSGDNIDYSPIPDLWHDIFGHLPLLLNSSVYGDFLKNIASEMNQASNPALKKALENLFWYTVESGVCQENGELRVYGSSQLSSFEEISYAVSEQVTVIPLEAVDMGMLSTNIHTIQTTIFEIPCFDYLAQIDFKLLQK
jgi:phenylalanine-4-hydroxylase